MTPEDWLLVMGISLGLPLATWLLWRGQRLSVGLLRTAMVKMARRAPKAYHVCSWFGTLLHELSHAIILLLGGLGIKGFSVKSESGHVEPRRMPKSPVGAAMFILAALAPMLFVPALVLVGVTLLLGEGVDWVVPVLDAGGSAAWESVRPFFRYPVDLLVGLAKVDVLDWRHAALLVVVLVGAPGTRPSFVKERSVAGGGFQTSGDLAVVRSQLKRYPVLLAAVPALLLIGFFAVRPFLPAAFWYPVEALWAVAFTGIVIALLAAGAYATAARIGAMRSWMMPVPWLVLIAGQVAGRFLDVPLVFVNGASVAGWAVAAWAFALVLPREDKYAFLDRA